MDAITLTGEIGAGEASGAAGIVRRRQMGPPWYLASVLVVILAMMAGDEAGRLAGGAELIGMALGAVVGCLAYVRLWKWMARRQFRARLAQRGLPLAFPVRIELGDRLVYEVGGLLQQADWACVTEVFRAGGYWVFLAQSTAIYVPRRLFADAQAERAFLKEALGRMTPRARDASPAAAAFAP